MEKIVINSDNNQTYDTRMEKARALLTDEIGNIYVCEMDGSIMLPGGTVELGENPSNTISRELKEELGIDDVPLQELIQIEYYHDGFPKYKQEGYERRLNVVYYYFSDIPMEIDLSSSTFSDYEIKHNIKINRYSMETLSSIISNSFHNKWKRFTDLEMLTILQIAREKRIIDKKIGN